MATQEARVRSDASALAFPPLLSRHQWGKSDGQPPRKHSLRCDLKPDTMRELQNATGGNFKLLQNVIGMMPEENSEKPNQQLRDATLLSTYGNNNSHRGSDIYQSMFSASARPQMNVFQYTRKTGYAAEEAAREFAHSMHAPKAMPAPAVPNISAWFAEYGRPMPSSTTSLSTFVGSTASVPRGDGTLSSSVRMHKGRILH
eukprot:5461479-Pleurochrysis_carterae.AAC.2